MSDKFQRDLLRGSLDLMILSVLAGGKKYGYLIQKQVRETSGSRVDLQAGTMYPILHRLEEEKLIRSSWEESTGRKRKWYELTAAGKNGSPRRRPSGLIMLRSSNRFWPWQEFGH